MVWDMNILLTLIMMDQNNMAYRIFILMGKLGRYSIWLEDIESMFGEDGQVMVGCLLQWRKQISASIK